MILVVLVMICLGYILRTATYIIPVGPMKTNMQKCKELFDKEGKYQVLNYDYLSTRLDNYTDAIMLMTAMYDDDEKSILEKSAGNYRFLYDGKNPMESVSAYLNDVANDSETDYARYWHGYLVLLKPILLFFDYTDVRVLNMIVQSLLTLYLLSLLYKDSLLKKYTLPLIASLLAVNPFTISYSMQYSWVYYILLISSILLISKRDYFIQSPDKLLLFFTIIGAMTSYFDLLTWPLATCAFPLVFVLITNADNWLKKLICVIKCGVSWGVGYLGMWCGCWAISSISLRKNIFKDAIDQVAFRVSNNISTSDVHIVTVKEVFRNQFFPLMKWPYAIMLFIVLIISLIELAKHIRKEGFQPKTLLLDTIPFILLCILPFIWFAATRNHSFLHYTFTWRTLIVTIFSGLSMIVKLAEDREDVR